MVAFAEAVRRFSEKAKLREDLVIRYIAFEAFRRIQQKTPVDTGRARASWRIGINAVDPSVAKERKRRFRGPDGIYASATIKLGKITWGDSVYITNNLPYIRKLEEGSSKQARNGMVSLTLAELNAGLSRMVSQVRRNTS